MNRRFEAFTLVELLIGLLIASALLVIVVLSLQNFTSRYYNVERSSSDVLTSYANHTLIRKDFLERKNVRISDPSYLFNQTEQLIDSISYYQIDSLSLGRIYLETQDTLHKANTLLSIYVVLKENNTQKSRLVNHYYRQNGY